MCCPSFSIIWRWAGKKRKANTVSLSFSLDSRQHVSYEKEVVINLLNLTFKPSSTSNGTLFMPPFTHSSRVTVPLLSTSMAVIMSFSTCHTIHHFIHFFIHPQGQTFPSWIVKLDEMRYTHDGRNCRNKKPKKGQTYWSELSHIPTQVICSPHHLGDYTIHFLREAQKSPESFRCNQMTSVKIYRLFFWRNEWINKLTLFIININKKLCVAATKMDFTERFAKTGCWKVNVRNSFSLQFNYTLNFRYIYSFLLG